MEKQYFSQNFRMKILQTVVVFFLTTTIQTSNGRLHWLTDIHVVNGHFDWSFDIDCRLSAPDEPVSFRKLVFGNEVEIVPDGKKYVKISNQTLRIHNLQTEDASEYVCSALGLEKKHIALIITSKPGHHDFGITISVVEWEVKCPGPHVNKRVINCTATGRGIVQLYHTDNAGRFLVIPKTKTKLKDVILKGGQTVQTLTYDILDGTTKDNGDYQCQLEAFASPPVVKWSRAAHLAFKVGPPKIKSFRSWEIVEGRKVTLRCKPDMTVPTEKVTFYVNGVSLKDRPKSKYIPSCQKLVIREVKFPDDNAVITCKLENKYGYAMKNTTVSVLVKPALEKSVDTVVQPDVPVECRIKKSNPPASISWQMQPYCHISAQECLPQPRLWKTVAGEQFQINSTTRLSQLKVSASYKRDFFFRCIASNKVGNDSHIMKFLYFREGPKPLEILSKDFSFNEDEKVDLTCTSRPGIFSKISWLKNGAAVSNMSGISVSMEMSSSYPSQSILTVHRAILNDTGNYTCVGKAIRGNTMTVSRFIQIKKTFAPIVQLLGPTNPKSGSSTALHCNVTSNPASKISWFKDGTEIHDIKLISDESQCVSSRNGYYFETENGKRLLSWLIICEVSFPGNNGTFTCVARNSLGSSQASKALNVLMKPAITLERESIAVEEGQPVQEICIASGNPKPLVYWRIKSSGKRMATNETGSSHLKIAKVASRDFTDYECFALNSLGNTTATLKIEKAIDLRSARISSARSPNGKDKHTNSYILLAVVFLSTLLIVVGVFVLLRRKKIYGGFYLFTAPPNPDHLRNIDPARALIDQTNGLPYDPVWEFPRKRIRLLDRLGSGAFGDVYLAEAVGIVCFEPRERISLKQRPLLSRKRSRSGSTSSRSGSSYRRLVTKVAVKKLKENASSDEMRDLVSELKILIHIGEHSNIVNLLGACTKGVEKDLMVILEYAPHGNLLSFLKSRRPILKTTWKKETVGMENELTTCDLAVIAYQVGKGMEFLSSRRCVHRDLAARNVLVGEGYVMKIADFGLARDIYKDDRYVKLSAGLLPIKWMAIEAIRERIFTHQSDVWSYGILLWEIMTMGGSPYPGLPVRNLLDYLVTGYRMEQPIYCPDDIYGLMADCWIENQDDRPTFTEIVGRMARIIAARLSPEVM
ncbi:fibroblast growth factor receptor 3-like [Rhopilema esculentum]|uniref:fibroblast growth factor receptor 3-like n=1 Tax=Rhopilema esculentum TaxID=499914 RepID=UPI0031D3127E